MKYFPYSVSERTSLQFITLDKSNRTMKYDCVLISWIEWSGIYLAFSIHVYYTVYIMYNIILSTILYYVYVILSTILYYVYIILSTISTVYLSFIDCGSESINNQT